MTLNGITHFSLGFFYSSKTCQIFKIWQVFGIAPKSGASQIFVPKKITKKNLHYGVFAEFCDFWDTSPYMLFISILYGEFFFSLGIPFSVSNTVFKFYPKILGIAVTEREGEFPPFFLFQKKRKKQKQRKKKEENKKTKNNNFFDFKRFLLHFPVLEWCNRIFYFTKNFSFYKKIRIVIHFSISPFSPFGDFLVCLACFVCFDRKEREKTKKDLPGF